MSNRTFVAAIALCVSAAIVAACHTLTPGETAIGQSIIGFGCDLIAAELIKDAPKPLKTFIEEGIVTDVCKGAEQEFGDEMMIQQDGGAIGVSAAALSSSPDAGQRQVRTVRRAFFSRRTGRLCGFVVSQ